MKEKVSTSLLLLLLAIPGAGAYGAPALEQYGNIPLAFTINQGQADSGVRFISHGNGCSMFFSPGGTTFVLSREKEPAQKAAKSIVFKEAPQTEPVERESFALKLLFEDANPSPEIAGEDRLSWNSNYFLGNDPSQWKSDVPNYGKVRLKEVYPGVDLVYYGNQNAVEYDFVVQPGIDPEKIRLRYDLGEIGSSLRVNDKGDLVVSTPVGDLVEKKPYCYQEIDERKVEVTGSYRIVTGNEFTFKIGEYDPAYPLVIDPEIVFSVRVAGGVEGIAIDDSGCVYIYGITADVGFPVTPGAYDEEYSGYFDAYVMKLNAAGTEIIYATFLGGSEMEEGRDIAVDRWGNVCVCGTTFSVDFPTTAGVISPAFNGGISFQDIRPQDMFCAKLNPDGSALVFSTFLGGSANEYCSGIAVDHDGNCVLVGGTSSTDFPTTTGAFDTSFNGGLGDVVVVKLNPTGSAFLYSTFLGGNVYEEGPGLALDGMGNAYITGTTQSSDFPTTPGAFMEDYVAPWSTVFVAKLNVSGSSLAYCTYLGGNDPNGADLGRAIAVDDDGCACITGYTTSGTFPLTANAIDKTKPVWDGEAFVSKLNSTGSALIFSTYLGGSQEDEAWDIALDGESNIFVTGRTSSDDFPLSPNTLDDSFNGVSDVFVVKLSGIGDMLFSTFVGGVDNDEGRRILSVTSDAVLISGGGNSADFPLGRGYFVMKLDIVAVPVQQTTVGLSTAVSNGWINQYCYTWNGYEYVPIGLASNTLITPWTGFWINISRDMDILFPAPDGYTPSRRRILTFTFQPNRYYLFGVPFVPESGEVSWLIEDDLGGTYEQDWRIAKWNASNSQYSVYTGQETFPALLPGRGFWLFHSKTGPRVVDFPGSDATLTHGVYSLKAPANENGQHSFHMLANPFPVSILWRNCQIRVPMTWTLHAAKPASVALEDIRSWNINLGVQSLDGEARDTYNRAGVILTESANPSLLNAAELLPPGEYIKLALKDPANSERDALAYDYREAGKPEYTWEVELTTTYSTIDTRLSLSGLAQVPEGYVLTLRDGTTGTVYEVGEDMTVPVTLSSVVPKKFILTAVAKPTGVEANQPAVFGIAGVSPNPFNPSTTVTFGLERAGDTTVKVYTLTGQLADTLINARLSAGTHTVTWNAGGHASGVYFITMESSGKKDVRKVTFMK